MTTAPYNPDNVFAKILRNEIPVTRLYDDDYALAFPDISPKAPTHVLVIPKGAYTDFADFAARASVAEQSGYIRAIGHVAQLCGVADAGYRLISNCGANAGQEVPHLHVHILGGKRLGAMLPER